MKFRLLLLAALTAIILAACGSSATPTSAPTATGGPTPAPTATTGPTLVVGAAQAQTDVYTPVTIDNCNTTSGEDTKGSFLASTVSFTEPPSKAITMNQHTTEVMLALGLEHRMVGTAYIDGFILPEYQTAYDSVRVLAELYPSKEVVLGVEPDFIYAGFASAFRDAAAGPQDELRALGINSYLTTALCNTDPDSMEDVYIDMRNISKIFGVPERGDAIVASMQDEINAVTAKLGTVTSPLRVFMYDSGEDAPFTSVCCSMFSHLVHIVGGENIFGDVEGRWATVNWEEVIGRDPEVIVLTEAGWSTAQEKIDFLTSNAALNDITAVKEGRYVALDFSSLVPSIRSASAIRTLAEGIYPGLFE